MGEEFTHIDESGDARMVDVSAKPKVRRTARAEGRIMLDPRTLEKIRQNGIAKGNVLATARVAGIMAAKRCSDMIPLCHNIEIEHAEVGFELGEDFIAIRSSTTCTDKTGIEMEALAAVSVAALTIYDMCKAVDKAMRIEGVRLVEKTKETTEAKSV
ncbi:MAG: cyclic pyranopterin monophosphate synthase MoaC [Spirochaetota bacterium]